MALTRVLSEPGDLSYLLERVSASANRSLVYLVQFHRYLMADLASDGTDLHMGMSAFADELHAVKMDRTEASRQSKDAGA